ncbi:LAME_0G09956g1_1 [Lachancea meyersii CBS 8951]|uniref:Translation initiation factor eIF2B subunit beta n=1 Tax=Lachancea meyersii CBS 8951 TaxID=1266667 RepID=A0A1G4K8W9_9SACH|nr:LAME_0G09956g1_1 [Lachancea meyersii CBS 8951]
MSGDINVAVASFIDRLKRRQVYGSYQVSLETLQLLKRFVSAARWSGIDDLIAQLRELGTRLGKAQPTEFTCGNIIRRVLALIRDEVEDEAALQNQLRKTAEPMISSMFSLLQKPVVASSTSLSSSSSSSSSSPSDAAGSTGQQQHQQSSSSNEHPKADMRQIIIQGIKDLIDEITNIDDGIQQIAIDLIHDREILLTPTPDSKTVLKFLIKARERNNRNFTVLVTEGYPNNTQVAHQFAKKLSEHGVETTVIPDTAVFALMSRVGKVIIGAKTVFTNGGTISSTAGVSSVCECAREFKTPVFAVAGLYKLSPLYPFDIEKFVEVGGSQRVLPTMENHRVGNHNRLDTVNPIADYVPPENIDIYITNIGGFAPSFIYRVVWDNYKQQDVNLED